jgi:hypothetical protein
VTFAVNEVGSMTAVPLSIEYPIDTAGNPAHVFVLAVSTNGEVSCAPLLGVETVMAWTDAVLVTSANAAKNIFFISEPLVTRRYSTGTTAGEVHCRCFKKSLQRDTQCLSRPSCVSLGGHIDVHVYLDRGN